MGRGYCNLVIKTVVSLFIVCAFYRCTPRPPQFEEMVGIWRADDGATIELKSDSTLIIKNFNSYFWDKTNDSINLPINLYGSWRSPYNDGYGHISLDIGSDSAIRSCDSVFFSDKEKWLPQYKYSGTQFFIKGEQGFLTINHLGLFE